MQNSTWSTHTESARVWQENGIAFAPFFLLKILNCLGNSVLSRDEQQFKTCHRFGLHLMCILPIVLLFGEYTTVTWRSGHPTITFVTCTDAKICSIAQHHCLPLVCALLPHAQGHCAFFMLSAFPESQARTIPQVSMLPFIGNNLSHLQNVSRSERREED